MRSKFRSSIVAAVAAAVTLTSLNLTPAQAAPKNSPQVANSATTDLSARRHYRGNNAAALAMFGLVAGGIAVAVAADRYNDGYYDDGGPYYAGYGGGYYGGGHRGGFHGGFHHGGFHGGHGGGHHGHR